MKGSGVLAGFESRDQLPSLLDRYVIVEIDTTALRHSHTVRLDRGWVRYALHDRQAAQGREQVNIILGQLAVDCVGRLDQGFEGQQMTVQRGDIARAGGHVIVLCCG
jgi:hypothetical protein